MATKKNLSAKTGKKTPAAKKAAVKKSAPAKKAAAKKTSKASPAAKKAVKAPKKAAKAPLKGAAKARKTKDDEASLLARSVVKGILDRKGENIVCLDLRSIENAVCDYFIICEANSNIQVEAIADSVTDMVKKELGQRPYRSEGWENALWILVDYIDVVVHVFQRDTRHFYNLESLWADGEKVNFEKELLG